MVGVKAEDVSSFKPLWNYLPWSSLMNITYRVMAKIAPCNKGCLNFCKDSSSSPTKLCTSALLSFPLCMAGSFQTWTVAEGAKLPCSWWDNSGWKWFRRPLVPPQVHSRFICLGDQAKLLRDLSHLDLKTFKDGNCTTSVYNHLIVQSEPLLACSQYNLMLPMSFGVHGMLLWTWEVIHLM